MNSINIKSRLTILVICLVLFFCSTLSVIYIKTDKYPPAVSFHSADNISKNSCVTIRIKNSYGLESSDIQIQLAQGENYQTLYPSQENWVTSGDVRLQVLPAQATGLTDGPFTLKVKTRSRHNKHIFWGIFAPFWSEFAETFTIDLEDPSAYATLSPLPFANGSSALVTISASEALEQAMLKNGCGKIQLFSISDKHYIGLVAFAHDTAPEKYMLELLLKDKASNASTGKINIPREHCAYRADSIYISDKFLLNKQAEFKEYLKSDASPLELYLKMNNEVRVKNYKQIEALCQNSVAAKLWQGAFLPMPNATRRSEFADKRSYIYKGKVIDQQVHLGLDYASVLQDKIPASNTGRIAFCGYLGIHGNAVLIDHGLGLFSLYSHLSTISVAKGDLVQQGDFIGQTGTSGMAGGDHLHFEIIVNGISVNPDFWFDEAWVENNIEKPLQHFINEANNG